MENKTINDGLAGNYIAAMMDLTEFDLNLNFKQAKYLASIMVTMQKHSIDEILRFDDVEQKSWMDRTSNRLEILNDLICKFDEENLHIFNLPENN